LMELHGGTVTAESNGEGHGATFTVKFPLQSPVSAEQNPDHTVRNAGYAAGRPLAGARVLVVDDEPDVLDVLLFVLEDAGAQVTSASSVQEALGLLQSFQPEIMITDVGMPDADGYSLLTQVRALGQSSKIPIVALTAYAKNEDRDRGLSAGFQAYLTKPVEPDDLIAVLVDLLSR
jgi:CheY-like chemotaxis protein